jgi:hypothetical protein
MGCELVSGFNRGFSCGRGLQLHCTLSPKKQVNEFTLYSWLSFVGTEFSDDGASEIWGSKLHCFFSLMEKVEKEAGGSPKANEAGGVHCNFSHEEADSAAVPGQIIGTLAS